MKYLLFLPLLLLAACSTPQETAINGESRLFSWVVPPIGATFVFSFVTTASQFTVPDSSIDTLRLTRSSVDDNLMTVERFDNPGYYNFIILDRNGDLSIGGDSLGNGAVRFPTGGGPPSITRVKDSIGIGDTTSYTHTVAFCGLEYVRSVGELMNCPHVVDSEYVIHRFTNRIDTIIVSSNYWFDPTRGGYYAREKYSQWRNQGGAVSFQTTEANLVAYKP